MDLLDAPLSSPPSAPLWGTVARYGTLAGLAFTLAAHTLYRLGLSSVTLGGLSVAVLSIAFVSAAAAFLAVRHQRDKLDGGYIEAGKAMAVGLLCVATGLLLLSVWNYLFVNYIEPEYLDNVKQQIRDQWSSRLGPEDLARSLDEIERLRQYPNILMNSIRTDAVVAMPAALAASFFMVRRFRV